LRSEVAFLRGEVEARRDGEWELRVLLARLEERFQPTPALAEGPREELKLVKDAVRQLPAGLLSKLCSALKSGPTTAAKTEPTRMCPAA